MGPAFTGLQLVDMVLYSGALVVCVAWAYCRIRHDFWFMLNPIIYALHGTMFYVFLFLERVMGYTWFECIDFMVWSALLRLHSIFAVLGTVLYLISKRRINGYLIE